jgi:hypothetical protein
MSENLPVPRTSSALDQITTNGKPSRVSALSNWIGSPVGRAIAQALPDVLRAANRPEPVQPRSYISQILPPGDGASGVTLSEVEVDINVPFIRRVTIRSASSWSVAPGVISAEQSKRRRGRWKLRALTAGVLGVAGLVLARRTGVTLPERLNPVASLPSLTASTPSITPARKNPGVAE